MKRVFVGVCCLLALLTCGPAFANEPIVIVFSHVVAADTPKGKAALYFAEIAGRLTGGAVRVEVYGNSTLYRDKDEMEALQLGAVQMLAPSLAKFSPLGVREFEVFDLPYIFDSTEMLHRVTQGALGKSLLKKLEPKGIKGLAFWDNGFKSFSANRPLHTPADFKGLRMRIQSSKVLEAQMRALDALPHAMAFSDVYKALQLGVVDGTENPHSNFYSQRMHEVQSHMTLTEHGYLGYAVITNKKFWDSLPVAIRGHLEEAMRLSTDYANKIASEENDKALAKIRETGKTRVYVPTSAERNEFKRAMIKTHIGMAQRIGAETIQAIYAETGFDPSKL